MKGACIDVDVAPAWWGSSGGADLGKVARAVEAALVPFRGEWSEEFPVKRIVITRTKITVRVVIRTVDLELASRCNDAVACVRDFFNKVPPP